jgi:hypothetical protein
MTVRRCTRPVELFLRTFSSDIVADVLIELVDVWVFEFLANRRLFGHLAISGRLTQFSEIPKVGVDRRSMR